MAAALVLNASFEPLCIVSARRALILTLTGKAELVHATDNFFHSEKLTLAVPSVVRLSHYVKVPYLSAAALNRRSVFMRDGGRCQYCDAVADSIDHVVPRSRGGEHSWDNVVAACRLCNSRKRDRLIEETNFVLRSKPRPPRHRVWLLAYAGDNNPHWEQYLMDPAVPA